MTTCNHIIPDLDTLFLYLSNATLCISYEDKETVFNNMAYKLEEWADVSRDEIRKIFEKYGVDFKELCYSCNESLADSEDSEKEKSHSKYCKDCIEEKNNKMSEK